MITVNGLSSFSRQGKRENQEDFICHSSNDMFGKVFVVCDGMGGHGHGEIASEAVAKWVFDFLTELGYDNFDSNDMQSALDFAVKELSGINYYQDEKVMGTTIVVAIINEYDILIGHVGDSRCYLFDKYGTVKFRTTDHSKVQEAVKAEILTEDEARINPYKNILTRCVSANGKSVTIDTDCLQIEDEDILMLCTDGVTDALCDTDLQKVMTLKSINIISETIQSICIDRSKDNFSGIILSLSNDDVHAEPDSGSVPGNDLSTVSSDDALPCCKYCGSQLQMNSNFCPKCGKRISEFVGKKVTINQLKKIKEHVANLIRKYMS